MTIINDGPLFTMMDTAKKAAYAEGFRKGQEAMRETAAKSMEGDMANWEEGTQYALSTGAAIIRALPLQEPSDR